MGYSNVAGALNVFTSTSTQDLVVRGDALHLGNIVSTKGFATFGNLSAGNLVVTGNFTVTATNTQVTNSLSINNFGTTTALKVVQFEGGGPGHTHNVAEFWDFTTLAMVIDPEGNVGIHTTSSPGYSLTVGGGASVDALSSQLYTGNAYGLSNLNSANLINPLTSLQLSNTQSNITSLGTLVNLNVSGTANVANGFFTTANVTGGLGANTAFFNLLKTNTSNTGSLNAANGAVSNLLCSNLNVITTANMVTLTVTGVLNGGLYIGNASGLSNLNSSNLVGNVANANVAGVVTNPAQPNITQVGTLTGLFSSGNVTASFFAGQGNALTNLQSSVLVGNVANANVALVVSQPSQPNITSVGILTGLNVSGTSNLSSVTSLLYIGNASGLSNLNSSNLVGNVAAANVASSVTNPAQPNITSVGVLTGLNVTGISNLSTVTSLLYIGNASGLSNLNSSNLVGNVANADVALVVSQPAQPNITSVGTLTGLNVSGTSNLSTTNITTLNTVSVFGSSLNITGNSNLYTLNLVSENVITSNLTNLTVSGTAIVGPAPTAIQANLHVEQGSIFIGNSAVVGATVNTTSITQGTLVFDNTANTSVIPNKIVLFSNTAGGVYAGFGVGNATGGTTLDVTYHSRSTHIFYTGVGATTEVMRLGSSGGFSLGSSGTSSAKLYVAGAFPNSNIHVRIDSSNIALVTSGSGLVGFGTLTPTANLHVIGNVFASNALSTANMFITGTANIQGISNLSTTNVTTLNAASIFGTNLNVTGTSNLSTTNVTTLNTSSLSASSLNVTGTSNLSTANITTLNTSVTSVTSSLNVTGTSNLSTTNITTLNTSVTSVTSSLNVTGTSNLSTTNVTTLNTSSLSASSLNVTGTSNLSTTNVTSLTVRTLANIYDANVTNTVFTNNIYAAGFTSNTTNTVFNFDTLTIPFITSTTLNVSSTSNLSTTNITTLNVASIFGTSLNVTGTSNLSTTNVTTLNTSALSASSLNVTSGSNLFTTNITTLNAASIFGTSLNVTGTSNLSTLTVRTQANIQTLNVASISTPVPVPASSGLFMNLNATYTLNATGNWTGNIAGTITSNLFTLFAPNPVASWTTYGANPIITGPTASGGFRFSQTGPYQFNIVLTSDNNIKTIALSSNTSDVHSNLADPGVWLYCYRISVGQDPSVPVQIPFYVDSTSKYYFVDFEAMNTSDNIHRTAYTNVTAEGYTGSYVTLRPV